MDMQKVKQSEEEHRIGSITINNEPLVSLVVDSVERICLAELSNKLLKNYSYNEIHNRRVALGITCVQCTPAQLEVFRKAKAMPTTSRRCGMITRREAERLFNSFFNETSQPKLPTNFVFSVHHNCGWGCSGLFIPSKYNSSRAKCIQCTHCAAFFSPNKFIFHFHQTESSTYVHPNAANFNAWRRHISLSNTNKTKELEYAWEDVKALFNGGSRKRKHLPSPPEDVDDSLPSNALYGSTGGEVGHSALSTMAPRLPAPTLPTFPSSFPSSFFCSPALTAQSSLLPIWPPPRHIALNDLLHSSQLLVPALTSSSLHNKLVNNLATNLQTSRSTSSDETVSSSISVNELKSESDAITYSTSTSSKSASDAGKQIKRPWIDNFKIGSKYV